MRTVFTIDLQPTANEERFASNDSILTVIRSFGWEPTEIAELKDEKTKEEKYKQLAEKIFGEMPEIAVAEKTHVIFYGYFGDYQTKFIVTRRVEGQITFRLLHPILPRLQKSTEKIIRQVLKSPLGSISDQIVSLYELGQDHVILEGRVIPSALREAIRSDKKDVFLIAVPLAILAVVVFILIGIDLTTHSLVKGTAERLSTALITTALVSALGFIQTYLNIRRNRLIAWSYIEA